MYIARADNAAPLRALIFYFDIGSSKYNRKYVKGMKNHLEIALFHVIHF